MPDVTTSHQPASLPAVHRNSPPAAPARAQIRGKLRAAIAMMVWEGADIPTACRETGFTASAMRKALARPHVIAFLKQEREVFRASISAKNIHRAAEIRDQNDNKQAALNAIRLLEQLGEEDNAGRSAAYRFAPGVVIVVGADSAHMAHERGNAAKPLIDHEPVSHGEGERDE